MKWIKLLAILCITIPVEIHFKINAIEASCINFGISILYQL